MGRERRVRGDIATHIIRQQTERGREKGNAFPLQQTKHKQGTTPSSPTNHLELNPAIPYRKKYNYVVEEVLGQLLSFVIHGEKGVFLVREELAWELGKEWGGEG